MKDRPAPNGPQQQAEEPLDQNGTAVVLYTRLMARHPDIHQVLSAIPKQKLWWTCLPCILPPWGGYLTQLI